MYVCVCKYECMHVKCCDTVWSGVSYRLGSERSNIASAPLALTPGRLFFAS